MFQGPFKSWLWLWEYNKSQSIKVLIFYEVNRSLRLFIIHPHKSTQLSSILVSRKMSLRKTSTKRHFIPWRCFLFKPHTLLAEIFQAGSFNNRSWELFCVAQRRGQILSQPITINSIWRQQTRIEWNNLLAPSRTDVIRRFIYSVCKKKTKIDGINSLNWQTMGRAHVVNIFPAMRDRKADGCTVTSRTSNTSLELLADT